MSKYKSKIGVCGMHGKSTVTSMLNHIFTYGNKEPTTFCGGEMVGYGNEVIGKGDYFIFEACEYLDAFLGFYPTESIITNIDYDHPDYFKSTEQIVSSFQKYASLNEKIYINSDDMLSREIKHENIVTYGIHNSADYISKITHSPALNEFSVIKNGVEIARCKLKLYGEHFIYDALGAFAIAYENGISAGVIENALSTFEGTKRRMEFIKKTDTGVDIFCDYGHHPTEIKSTISSLKSMGYKKICCVFQAHTFSRTYYLYDEFKNAFCGVDSLIIAPTFSAREENVFGVSEENLALDCGGEFVADIEKIAHRVASSTCGCVVLMGAGDLSQRIKALIL
jgi:UDP-N-acetylmuramate--alanine ligase